MDTTRPYAVLISIENNDLKTECSCPYNFEGACKYIVAAILALADDPKLASINTSKQEHTSQKEVDKLLAKASNSQVKSFLKKILMPDGEICKDFDIFLQGPKETEATSSAYKEKIKHGLDKLDLDGLLET